MSELVLTALWAVYLVSVLLAFWIFFRMTRWQGKLGFVSGLLRILFLAVMLTPAELTTNPELMAPAFVVAMFDFFQGYEDGAFEAMINLGVALVAAITIYIIYSVILLIVHSRRKN